MAAGAALEPPQVHTDVSTPWARPPPASPAGLPLPAGPPPEPGKERRSGGAAGRGCDPRWKLSPAIPAPSLQTLTSATLTSPVAISLLLLYNVVSSPKISPVWVPFPLCVDLGNSTPTCLIDGPFIIIGIITNSQHSHTRIGMGFCFVFLNGCFPIYRLFS